MHIFLSGDGRDFVSQSQQCDETSTKSVYLEIPTILSNDYFFHFLHVLKLPGSTDSCLKWD